MWEFFDRLIAVAIPRIRDFRGLPAHSWDGRGNYTFGLNDQAVFPEIDYDRSTATWHGHHDRDVCYDRRPRASAARGLRLPVQARWRSSRRPEKSSVGSGPRWRQVAKKK